MADRGGDRAWDVVLLGATGFTGALTAEHLLARAPAGTRVALAGRSRDRVQAVVDRLVGAGAGGGVGGVGAGGVGVVVADVTDPAALRSLAESCRVAVTTVGPYLRHGDPLVAACAAAGTDYLDLTGEPEFVDRTWLRHHATAEASGARLVHAVGFDSVPHDLGALFTVQQLPEDVPLSLRGYVTARGAVSGGTFASALEAMGTLRSARRTAAERRRAEPPPPGGRRVRVVTGRPGPSREAGAWVLPLPTVDPQVVVRSAAALPRYGPNFSYAHHLAAGPLAVAGIAAGVGVLAAVAQVAPARHALERLRPSGSGPSAEQRDKGWFRVRFVGEGGGRRVVTEVAGGEPGYAETSRMLGEAALCLAADDLPVTAGQVTTAVAMGDALRVRLEQVGMTFRVLSDTAV